MTVTGTTQTEELLTELASAADEGASRAMHREELLRWERVRQLISDLRR